MIGKNLQFRLENADGHLILSLPTIFWPPHPCGEKK